MAEILGQPQPQHQAQQHQAQQQQGNNGTLSMLTIEALWHFRGSSREGVESIDFHPILGESSTNPGMFIGRMCTAGLDGVVRVWALLDSTEETVFRSFNNERGLSAAGQDYSFLHFVARLAREKYESLSCFTARFSPCGNLIASSYSDGEVHVWTQDTNWTPPSEGGNNDDDAEAGSEKWKAVTRFNGPQHDVADIVDIAFTPDSSHLCMVCASGAFLVYGVGAMAKKTGYIAVKSSPDAHTSALGIAMDPFGLLVGTTGSDSKLRFFDMTVHVKEANGLDWTLKNDNRTGIPIATANDVILPGAGGPFFRRSSWSPDGALAAFPYGRVFSGETALGGADSSSVAASAAAAAAAAASSSEQQQQQSGAAPAASSGGNNSKSDRGLVTSSVILVLRNRLSKPAVALTLTEKSAVRGCRFAPKVFEPFAEDATNPDRCKAKGSWGPMLYRYALAVWTSSTVVIYTSDCSARHSSFTNLHYAHINDVAWAPACRMLAVASEDQTVSLISVSDTLGSMVSFRQIQDRLPPTQVPPLVAAAVKLQDTIYKAAQDNEAATIGFVTKKTVNKTVTVQRRKRGGGAEGKKDEKENNNDATTKGTAAPAGSDGAVVQKSDENNNNGDGPRVPENDAAAAAAKRHADADELGALLGDD